ncbi:LOW QUALITY PROTEIN: hypothetical protein V2J09_023434 [Rumex salicifolius]
MDEGEPYLLDADAVAKDVGDGFRRAIAEAAGGVRAHVPAVTLFVAEDSAFGAKPHEQFYLLRYVELPDGAIQGLLRGAGRLGVGEEFIAYGAGEPEFEAAQRTVSSPELLMNKAVTLHRAAGARIGIPIIGNKLAALAGGDFHGGREDQRRISNPTIVPKINTFAIEDIPVSVRED